MSLKKRKEQIKKKLKQKKTHNMDIIKLLKIIVILYILLYVNGMIHFYKFIQYLNNKKLIKL